jgi:hypothetical protein
MWLWGATVTNISSNLVTLNNSFYLSQHPVNRRPADFEGLHDFRRRLQFAHMGGVYRSRAALVDAGPLGLGDPFEPALAV